jgi:cytochrome c553
MNPDGSDINCLSVHETNEWNPSVTHDGRIVYTRWDYVDRHGCVAHLPWITTCDGRDSRAVHGNFALRNRRPDMEVHIRAMPASHKFVATAAPHHGQAFGSLVIIDPDTLDDDAMGPLKRLTPDAGFPESQGGPEVYGTAWPLSQDYFLCVWCLAGRRGGRGAAAAQSAYGIYLLDAFGNKELIYRDPEVSCMSPMPLRARPVPPLVPAQAHTRYDPSAPNGPGATPPAEATLAVMNVYDSVKPWPEGTQIKALRVLQLVPMPVPSGRPPHETGVRIKAAGDSVVPTRYVLGTVPVEEDGSAQFRVPAYREVFFQALDERGLAVQSMRSATYARAGELLVCAGCHERRESAPSPPGQVPLALRRPPSALQPDVDGSNPFSYARLVQPVLDANCVACHKRNVGKAPNLDREPLAKNWYASYNTLVKYGFTDYGSPVVTTPGRFGARATPLLAMLEQGHHDVKLPPEDLHRLALWLDCCSMFYGVYEKEGGQAQLRGEVAKPTLE